MDPSVLDALPEPLLLVEATGGVVRANAPARKLLGIGKHEKPLLTELVEAADEPRVATFLRRASGSRQLLPGTFALRGANGSGAHVRCDAGVAVPASDGRPATLLVRLRPRTQATTPFTALNERIAELTAEVARRTQAEADLRDQREWFRVTLSSIGDGVIATDTEGRVTFINASAEHYTGWEASSAIGRPLDEVFRIVNEQTRVPVGSPVAQALSEGIVVGLANHTVLIRLDGTELAIADSAAPIRDARDRLIGVVLVFQDETVRRFNEATRIELLERERDARRRAEEASHMKDEFLATISHELRTPLNAIVGWAELLSDPAQRDEDLDHGIDVIGRNARAQVALIDELLDVARITSGRVHLDLAVMDLADTLRMALDTVAHAAQMKGLRLEHDGLDRPLAIVGDVNRIRQAVWNLLSNAIKFSPRGESVRLSLRQRPSVAEITVTDRGEGLDAPELGRVFEPFWQRDPSRIGRDRGLGLGLAIVMRIAEAHGGTVDVTSAGRGHGASFRIRLPIRATVPPAEMSATASSEPFDRKAREHELAGVRVLVVEDDHDSREVLELVLSARGASVSTVSDAGAAVAVLDRERPDVIVSDIAMPGVDGYTMMRRVRARPPARGGNIPAIALTAFAGEQHRRLAEESGFQRHLAKPAMPDDVIAAILAVLGIGT